MEVIEQEMFYRVNELTQIKLCQRKRKIIPKKNEINYLSTDAKISLALTEIPRP